MFYADDLSGAEAARNLADWLVRKGRFLPDNDVLFAEFCERVAAAGIPLDRATLHLRALHPEYRGVARIGGPGTRLRCASWITASRRPRPISKARCAR